MFELNRHLRPIICAIISSASLFCTASAALAKDPLEAAKDLAGASQTDPNGFTLMIVSICMLFVFALALIIATTVHAFKKKPAQSSRSAAAQVQEPHQEPTVVS